ncbi:MAG: aldo/keto reductase [Cyclobacteriaceae bacterium]|nr:aldo/keto reductase [Cyclobacteriaceae bacterium]
MRIQLHPGLEFSRLVHGYWRLAEWNLSDQQLLTLIHDNLEMGITTVDHADIYGDYSCEGLFGGALKLEPALRDKLEIVTKCGIKLISDKFPERKLKHYDYSVDHIVQSVEQSLRNLATDRIDLLLLHRPSPFFDPQEVVKAFDQLKTQGKVLFFGVSNFTARQFEMLQAYWDGPLVTNQLEISPYCLDSFLNGSLDFLQKEDIKPMAWSPLGGGKIFNPTDTKGARLLEALNKVGHELQCPLSQVIYQWILKHPARILPVIGSGKSNRIKEAVAALALEMTLEQWFEIYEASLGWQLP